MAGGAGGEYAWEQAYERPWEGLQVDEHGRLTDAAEQERQAAARAKKSESLGAVQRGMLRHLVVVVDASAAMLASDLPPSRLVATCMALKDFTKEWFDQNPVGSLSVVAVRSGMGHVLSPLTATPKHITDPLDALGGQAEHRGRSGTSTTTSAAVTAMCGGGPVLDGSFSFQAALETATHELSLVPTQAGREVLIVHGALSSVDAGDIWRTVEGMQGTTVHVIGLSGEVFVARRIAEKSGGKYGVAETYDHLTGLLAEIIPPPPRSASEAAADPAMVLMGFPRMLAHANALSTAGHVCAEGYLCPRCASIAPTLPSACEVCGLQLVAAAQLARSHHYMDPVPPFLSVPSATGSSAPTAGQLPGVVVAQAAGEAEDDVPAPHVVVTTDAAVCAGCAFSIPPQHARFVCPASLQTFCQTCDTFIHEQLHTNPAVV